MTVQPDIPEQNEPERSIMTSKPAEKTSLEISAIRSCPILVGMTAALPRLQVRDSLQQPVYFCGSVVAG
jgi:hypothetical protein